MNEIGQKRVLIVEDNQDIASLLEISFKEGCYGTEVCENGDGVFELAEKYKPDLIILDIILPGQEGMEVLKELRPHRPRGNLGDIAHRQR